MVRLWHSQYGFLAHNGETWTNFRTGVRYGKFLCDFMSQSINLPLSEVILDLP